MYIITLQVQNNIFFIKFINNFFIEKNLNENLLLPHFILLIYDDNKTEKTLKLDNFKNMNQNPNNYLSNVSSWLRKEWCIIFITLWVELFWNYTCQENKYFYLNVLFTIFNSIDIDYRYLYCYANLAIIIINGVKFVLHTILYYVPIYFLLLLKYRNGCLQSTCTTSRRKICIVLQNNMIIVVYAGKTDNMRKSRNIYTGKKMYFYITSNDFVYGKWKTTKKRIIYTANL